MSLDFEKIARKAVAQCQEYETQIQALVQQLSLNKKASCVDQQLIQKSVAALIKTGSLKEWQAEETKKLLATDPNASLRALNAICEGYTDAKNIVKTQSLNLDGGVVISEKESQSENNLQDAYQGVVNALGLKLK